MADLDSYLYGERPRVAVVAVLAVGVAAAAVLVSFGLVGSENVPLVAVFAVAVAVAVLRDK